MELTVINTTKQYAPNKGVRKNVNLYENVEYSSRTTQVIKDMPDKERAKY